MSRYLQVFKFLEAQLQYCFNYFRVYRKSQVYSKLSNTQMMSPKDTAVWWIEYVLKAEGNVDHLKYNLDQIPWYQYYLVDLAGIFIAGIFLVVFVLFRMAVLLRRLCFRSKAKKKKQWNVWSYYNLSLCSFPSFTSFSDEILPPRNACKMVKWPSDNYTTTSYGKLYFQGL